MNDEYCMNGYIRPMMILHNNQGECLREEPKEAIPK